MFRLSGGPHVAGTTICWVGHALKKSILQQCTLVFSALFFLFALPSGSAFSQSTFKSYEEAEKRLRELNRGGDNQKTLEVLNVIIAMPGLSDDQKCQTLQSRSVTLANLGRVEEGIADRQECVNIADRSNETNLRVYKRRDLANLLRDAGRFDDALKAIDQAEAILGPGTFSHYRGSLLEANKDFSGAATLYERYLANPPAVTALHALTRPTALSSLAWIKFRQGDEKQALSLMQQSYSLRSSEPSAQISLAYMLANVGRIEDAIVLLASSESKIKEKNIRDILVVSRGIMELARGKHVEAVKIMAEGMPSFGNELFPNLYLHFARLRAGQTGNPDTENIAAKLNLDSWNGKLTQYILGKIDRQQLEAVTKHPLVANERSQRCTMNFVTGQRALLEQDFDTARRDLAAVLELCHPGGQNYLLAKYDLERLKK